MASGGEGPNSAANYAIIYEPIDHADTDRQVIKRIARTGQLKHCFIYRFITKNQLKSVLWSLYKKEKNYFNPIGRQR